MLRRRSVARALADSMHNAERVDVREAARDLRKKVASERVGERQPRVGDHRAQRALDKLEHETSPRTRR